MCRVGTCLLLRPSAAAYSLLTKQHDKCTSAQVKDSDDGYNGWLPMSSAPSKQASIISSGEAPIRTQVAVSFVDPYPRPISRCEQNVLGIWQHAKYVSCLVCMTP